MNTTRKPSGSGMPDWLNSTAKPIQFGGAENRGRRDDRQLGARPQTKLRDEPSRPNLSRSSVAAVAAASKWAQPSTSTMPQQSSWIEEKTGVVTPRTAGIDSRTAPEGLEDIRWRDNTSTQESEHSRQGKRGKKSGKETGNFFQQEEHDEYSKSSKSPAHVQHRPAHSKFKPKLVEKVSNDVYIPRNVTVANLSRLLGIQHSTTRSLSSLVPILTHYFTSEVLQRKMKAIGMENTDSNYSQLAAYFISHLCSVISLCSAVIGRHIRTCSRV